MKIKIAIIIVIIAAVALVFFNQDSGSNVPIVEEYQNKTVYTTDLSVDTNPLIGDCNERGGAFNECGSPCAPEEEFCTAVCAYTCEF